MRSLYALALAATLALPCVAHAQTPSVTPTPMPLTLTIRFDCDQVPWSCGDGPNDVRWQLYEVVGCRDSSTAGCHYERIGAAEPGREWQLRAGGRYKLFLAPNLDRSDRVSRTCTLPGNARYPYLGIHTQCAVYGDACAGPANWNLYAQAGAEWVPVLKHIGECSRIGIGQTAVLNYVLDWGLPGELSAAPTAAATMTAPPPATATVAPTVGIPTEAPTHTVAPTATDAPTATNSPTATRTAAPTATPARAALLLPMAWR